MTTSQRRELQFANLDEAVAEAERLASGEIRTTGKHTFGQILEHLARTHDMSSGKIVGPRPPWYMRLLVSVMRPMIINEKPLRPGFNLPKEAEAFFWPADEVDVAAALTHLKASVENYKSHGALAKHPMFGNLTPAQNLRLNCQHCALHLGYVRSA